MKRSRLTLVTAALALLAACGFSELDGALVITPQGWPDGVSQVDVAVTGEGMEPVNATYTGDSATWEPLTIPIGEDRTVVAVITVDNDSPVMEYTATATVDVLGGTPSELVVSDEQLVITRTKIVVPDEGNGRFVQVDDMTGAGWATLALGSLAPDPLTLERFDLPADVEIGPDGRIYASVRLNGEQGAVVALDSIVDTDYDTIFVDDTFSFGPDHLGIDWTNELVYIANGETRQLFSVPLAGGTATEHTSVIEDYYTAEFGFFEVLYLKGVTVGDDGTVYLLVAVDFQRFDLLALDLSGTGEVTDFATIFEFEDTGAFELAADLVISGDALFALIFEDVESQPGPVIQIDAATLAVEASYGTLFNGPPAQADAVYGPVRFTAHRNPEITWYGTFPDTLGDPPQPVDQITQILDIEGNGRSDYGSSGTGQDEFDFYAP